MIQIEGLSIQFGGRYLFHDIDLVIKTKDRIGLVGKNGAGKSTMLKVLIDEIRPDEGNIKMPNGIEFGYLPQEMQVDYQLSVYEETATAFKEIQELEKKMVEYERSLAEFTDYESPEYTKLIEKFSNTQERLQYLGGQNMRAEVEKVLKGLGFVNGDFDRPVAEFSGGWQMRIELAKILLRQPNYILLDEPTNHLDIESILWLEKFLRDYPGGILLISHDQQFLDHVCNRTVELVAGKAYDYSVPFSQFVAMREQRRERQISEKKKQDKYIEHTKMLIEKFRAKKDKAKFAQTLITKLERLIPIVIDDLETAKASIRFPAAPRSGLIVAKSEQLVKNYGDLNVLNKVNFEIERGEKIAFVGKNGEGKTTFAKIIAGKIQDYLGKFELGYNVTIGYFEQHQAESLDGKMTVLDTIDEVATGEMRLKVRSLLGAFLFSGEDVDKKVSVLSGGEKSRLALAKLMLEPFNLLILDEPTNHLDMRSKEILKSALRNYEGAMIVVSHDREFLKGLTDKVYEFRNKNLKMHYGDVFNFLDELKLDSLDQLGMTKNTNPIDTGTTERALTKEERIRQRQEKKDFEKSLKRISNKIKKSEKQIEEYEKQIATLEETMSDPDFYMTNPKANDIVKEYEDLQKTLETEMDNWETLTLELEEMQET